MREALIVLVFFIGAFALLIGLLWYASRGLDFLDAEGDPWR